MALTLPTPPTKPTPPTAPTLTPSTTNNTSDTIATPPQKQAAKPEAGTAATPPVPKKTTDSSSSQNTPAAAAAIPLTTTEETGAKTTVPPQTVATAPKDSGLGFVPLLSVLVLGAALFLGYRLFKKWRSLPHGILLQAQQRPADTPQKLPAVTATPKPEKAPKTKSTFEIRI